MQPQPSIEPEGLFDGLRAGPIVLGALVDNLATLLAFGVLFSALAPEGAGESSEATRKAVEQLSASSAFQLGSVLLGALCTVAGAFVGARQAGRLHVRHGGWIAVASTALSLLFLLPQPDPSAAPTPDVAYPFWAEVLGWLLILPAGMSGGWLARATASGGPEPGA